MKEYVVVFSDYLGSITMVIRAESPEQIDKDIEELKSKVEQKCRLLAFNNYQKLVSEGSNVNDCAEEDCYEDALYHFIDEPSSLTYEALDDYSIFTLSEYLNSLRTVWPLNI